MRVIGRRGGWRRLGEGSWGGGKRGLRRPGLGVEGWRWWWQVIAGGSQGWRWPSKVRAGARGRWWGVGGCVGRQCAGGV